MIPAARVILIVGCLLLVQLFFFSSRRRHTRLVSDWSSDVCSSDLGAAAGELDRAGAGGFDRVGGFGVRHHGGPAPEELPAQAHRGVPRPGQRPEIGRASCRGKEGKWGAAGGVKKRREHEHAESKRE